MPTADDIRAQIARLQGQAAQARQRAARAGAAADRLEAWAGMCPPPLNFERLRLAALQRHVQSRHLVSARLFERFAERLARWLVRHGQSRRQPAFLDSLATAVGVRSATVVLCGRRQDDAVVGASDATARAAHDLEAVFGEGPTRSAVADGQVASAAGQTLCDRWPRYGPEVALLGVTAVVAVPLQPSRLGAVCVYGGGPVISEEACASATSFADALPLTLVHATLDSRPDDGAPPLPMFGEADFGAVVHQAAGMVSQACGCDVSDALALLRARAFADGQPTEKVAAEVVSGELRLP